MAKLRQYPICRVIQLECQLLIRQLFHHLSSLHYYQQDVAEHPKFGVLKYLFLESKNRKIGSKIMLQLQYYHLILGNCTIVIIKLIIYHLKSNIGIFMHSKNFWFIIEWQTFNIIFVNFDCISNWRVVDTWTRKGCDILTLKIRGVKPDGENLQSGCSIFSEKNVFKIVLKQR